jgi:hypothetical protein
MNNRLTEEIANHIFANLGVLPSNFVSQSMTRPLTDKQFLLPEKLTFEVDDQTFRKNVYGCQASLGAKEFKMLLADCTQDRKLPEYCLYIQLKDSPAYCVYLLSNKLDPEVDSEVMIALTMDGQHWMPCSAYLQATFLAGMEQLRDIPSTWVQLQDYQDNYQQLLSFIKYHQLYNEALDERQEV